MLLGVKDRQSTTLLICPLYSVEDNYSKRSFALLLCVFDGLFTHLFPLLSLSRHAGCTP